MSVPSINLRIEKGTNFESTFNVTNTDGSPFNLTGYIATSKIKKYPTSSSSKSFSTSITALSGEIKISMLSSTTSDLSSGRNYYDLIITRVADNKSTKVFEGTIIVVDTVSV